MVISAYNVGKQKRKNNNWNTLENVVCLAAHCTVIVHSFGHVSAAIDVSNSAELAMHPVYYKLYCAWTLHYLEPR